MPLMERRKSDTHWEVIYAISWGTVPPLIPVGFLSENWETRVEDVGHDQPSADLAGASQMEPERRLLCIL
jgi:hypothetical protein